MSAATRTEDVFDLVDFEEGIRWRLRHCRRRSNKRIEAVLRCTLKKVQEELRRRRREERKRKRSSRSTSRRSKSKRRRSESSHEREESLEQPASSYVVLEKDEDDILGLDDFFNSLSSSSG